MYFAHTTLFALSTDAPTYEELWAELGALYTFHGALMIVGGALFGFATLRARVLPGWTAYVFLLGLSVNLAVAFIPVPELFQTVGTLARNVGLIGMGLSVPAVADR